MSETMLVDGIKVTQFSYSEFTDIDFQAPSAFYVMDASQNYTFIHTRDRKVAQEVVDEIYGVGRYKIRAAKDVKSKSKLESGGLSCYGSNSRKGFSPQLKKTV